MTTPDEQTLQDAPAPAPESPAQRGDANVSSARSASDRVQRALGLILLGTLGMLAAHYGIAAPVPTMFDAAPSRLAIDGAAKSAQRD